MPGKLLLMSLALITLSGCGTLTSSKCPEFPQAPPELLISPPTLFLLQQDAPKQP